jgi:hypothetical protein
MKNDKDSKMFEKDSEGKLRYIPGSWKRMFQMPKWYVILVVLVVVMSFYMIKDYKDVYNNPCDYCKIDGCASYQVLFNVTQDYDPSNQSLNAVYDYVTKDASTTKLII